MKSDIFQRASFPCPVCTGNAKIRESEALSHTTRRLKYLCLDVECGHTWVAHLTYVSTLSPSALGPVHPMGPRKRPPPEPLTNPLIRPLTETRKPAA
ncbi:ogr/Delta-like zinc finger family protein [Asticcacaulis sp. BYS171W]|uniref:Ogr/Delta-like zinc finger family protein n=1 Tax=Asticcacaulis aquaticus TaxID=2984212 RepID=A0ABT5HUW3_9CAUL|nr:ogr/Delta-like zinc finger family protein [Asticcacaulis aquaticus]MDC7683241.1 ogr/Delta-like zinc finger family protein [Asticcacaulis aquaticus]